MWHVLLLMVGLLPLGAAAEGVRISYGVERFLWKEFDLDPAGHTLEETGFRHVLGLQGQYRVDPQWIGDLDARLVFGTVDYDGWDGKRDSEGNLINRLTTTTDYRGYGLEAGWSYFPPEEQVAGQVEGGLRLALGLDYWMRSLQGDGGYDEEYLVAYGRTGGVIQQADAWKAELGAKLPLATSERIDLSAYGFVKEVRLQPKGRLSLYAQLEYRLTNRLDLRLGYDGYVFDKSDVETVYNVNGRYYEIHQPKSDMHLLSTGVSLSL